MLIFVFYTLIKFKNWRESWENAYSEATRGKKEYDRIAQMDFEREEEYYNWKLKTRRTLVRPIEEMNLLQKDMWKQKLLGVTKASETTFEEDGVEETIGTNL